jgi:hypothetical protein
MKIETKQANKVIVRITRKELWFNYLKSWGELIWDDYHDGHYTSLKEVSNVLLSEDVLDYGKLKKLFASGYTIFLLNADDDVGGKFLDADVLREIIVEDHDKEYKISHNYIVF